MYISGLIYLGLEQNVGKLFVDSLWLAQETGHNMANLARISYLVFIIVDPFVKI